MKKHINILTWIFGLYFLFHWKEILLFADLRNDVGGTNIDASIFVLIQFVLVLINVSGGVRIINCIIKIMNSADEEEMKRKIINTAYFMILANSIWSLKSVIEYYFK